MSIIREQRFTMDRSFFFAQSGTSITVEPPRGSRPQITLPELLPATGDRYLARLRVRNTGAVDLEIAENRTEGLDSINRDDLADDFETRGSIIFAIGDDELKVDLEGSDLTEPYNLSSLSNADEVTAFYRKYFRLVNGSTQTFITLRVTLPLSFKQTLFASETDEVYLIMLTLSHSSLPDDIRIVNNTENITSKTKEFIAFPFQIILPDDTSQGPPSATLRIDNVSREIIGYIREFASAISAKIEIIRASEPDTIEATYDGFTLRGVQADATTITGQLGVEDITIEAFPSRSFTPASFPGLF